MRFIFDCEDEVCLPAAYSFVEEVEPFIKKIKSIEINESEVNAEKTKVGKLKKVLKVLMCECPKETGELLSKMWLLEDGEKAPNSFKTIGALFSNEVAVDFFTSVMPSLVQMFSVLSPILKAEK
jgi:hypothetical protein